MKTKNLSVVIDLAEPPLPPASVRVLGAGRFGRIAVERLSKRFPGARLLVVEGRKERLEALRKNSSGRFETRIGDAVLSLETEPVPEKGWIVPAVPVHVAFEWLLRILGGRVEVRSVPAPEAVDRLVPNPYRSPDGTLYASFADFICPDSCSEPDEICTHTKGPRPGELFEVFGRAAPAGFRALVLRSLQLAPGVGGYTGGQLRALLDAVLREEGRCLIATSCRCHGVVNGLAWKNASRYGSLARGEKRENPD